MEEEVAEKRERVRAFAGETILRGEDFKRYVNQLRGKSNVYKVRQYLHLFFFGGRGRCVCIEASKMGKSCLRKIKKTYTGRR